MNLEKALGFDFDVNLGRNLVCFFRRQMSLCVPLTKYTHLGCFLNVEKLVVLRKIVIEDFHLSVFIVDNKIRGTLAFS